MRIALLTFSILLITIKLFAQNVTLSGKVLDSLSKEPLELAVITISRLSVTVVTDKTGSFIAEGEKGDSISISCTGYKTLKLKIVTIQPFKILLQPAAISLKEIKITNNPTLATYKTLSSLDLNMQPVKSAQDLLRLVPGLFIAQHMGGGKAEQIFLRGFDADHGTDVNISVDGIPVNMVTHAHGQGYADMHFLIPETVASYDFGKGPYYADKGDFTTAGYVSYNTKTVLSQDMIKIEAGQFNTYRVVTMISLLGEKAKENGQSAYIAAEGLFSDGGPFTLPEHFNRFNIMGKFNTRVGNNSSLTAEMSAMKSGWRASGEIPDRALREGYITSRFGALDSTQGGHTSRTILNIKLTTDAGNGWCLVNQLWYSHYYFNLVSNFTFNYYFPLTGDEFRQRETRDQGGYNGKVSKLTTVNNVTYTTTVGAGLRYDHISPIELDHTQDGKFLDYLQYGKAGEINLNGYFDESVCTGNWLINGGARFDYFHFSYQNLAPASDTIASGLFNGARPKAQKSVISPKLNIEYTFSNRFQLYLKAGKGFHSNEARVVIANQGYQVLPAAYGTDLGFNWKPIPDLFINCAVWYLYLQQEFVFGQDLIDQAAGPVKPSGRTIREGIDLSARYQLTSWLFANLNINPAKPRYLDSAKGHNYVELAPTLTSTAGLDFRLKNGWNGGLSYRYLHDRAANSDYSLTARGYFITDMAVNYTRKTYEIGISIENLFNREWDESQFEYVSQLKNETKPVDEVSYTPGVPFFAKLKFSLFF